ncbi:MAG: hypothetical protein NVS4B7_09930 [Ktedonobacteraceae bacterium]
MEDALDIEINHAVLIHADRNKVYDALTTAEGLDGWFTTGASVDAGPQGTIWFRWQNWGPDHITTEDVGTVLEAQRPQRFMFQWDADDPYRAITVEFKLASISDGEDTVVRLKAYGYHNTPASLKALADHAASWGEALTLLKFYVEHGIRY